jgi:murein L,D-transpeptidase YcbB/YkuD
MTARRAFNLPGFAALLLMLGLPQPAPAQTPAAPVQAQGWWDMASARELLAFGQDIGREGLNPADYALDALAKALASGTPRELDVAATRSFALIARDLADGHVPYGQRGSWRLSHPPLTPEMTEAMIANALAVGRVTQQLASLAPANADYQALKRALGATPPEDSARILALRVNMERWRWLPRSFGKRHVIVNVPAFELRLVDGGQTVAAHRVIVGKATTPTPQIGATISGVLFNPPWEVPQSIIAESLGQLVRTKPDVARARGYEWRRDPDGTLRVRQRPGANNALGRMKFLMPNPHAIYVHDTPSKQLFDRPVRAFSHGCIRLQNPGALAEQLLGPDWTAARIDGAIATGVSTPVSLSQPVPVAIVYLTAVSDAAGNVRMLNDIYGRDAGVAAALSTRPVSAPPPPS